MLISYQKENTDAAVYRFVYSG
uniref:Uncharacterized protein n=1 Tax=Anguilla anguilla TaxID=7936 RepID=A0A0E9TRJ4_ANGAN